MTSIVGHFLSACVSHKNSQLRGLSTSAYRNELIGWAFFKSNQSWGEFHWKNMCFCLIHVLDANTRSVTNWEAKLLVQLFHTLKQICIQEKRLRIARCILDKKGTHRWQKVTEEKLSGTSARLEIPRRKIAGSNCTKDLCVCTISTMLNKTATLTSI